VEDELLESVPPLRHNEEPERGPTSGEDLLDGAATGDELLVGAQQVRRGEGIGGPRPGRGSAGAAPGSTGRRPAGAVRTPGWPVRRLAGAARRIATVPRGTAALCWRAPARRGRGRPVVRRATAVRGPVAGIRGRSAPIPRRSVAEGRPRSARSIGWLERARRTPATRVCPSILVAGRPGWRVVGAVRGTPIGASIGSSARNDGWLPGPSARSGPAPLVGGRSPRTPVARPAIRRRSRTRAVRDRSVGGAGGGRIRPTSPGRGATGLALRFAARLR
jgi:hypothetical protein